MRSVYATAARGGLGIGIDAGGTFTDAVLYDFTQSRVLATAKAPTTHSEPSVGVAEALAGLPSGRLVEVRLVTLATTLATNAIVEDRGGVVGLVLIGYDDWSFARIEHQPVRRVAGRHRIDGSVSAELEEEAVRRAAGSFAASGDVESIAIVEWGGCRNPEFEIRAQAIARAQFRGPVQCAHDLTDELDCLRRATTITVNCRIAPVIVDLVRHVERVIESSGITAPLWVVRADGSVISAPEACRRPVEMVLSGPAASICGARALSDAGDAVIVDMGGTTTDVARLVSGRPIRNGSGAVVGGHRTTVRAPTLHTAGIGGDSRIVVTRSGRIAVGPRREQPLCVLAATVSNLAALLQELHATDLAELRLLPAAEVFVLQREPAPEQRLSEREQEIVAVLRDGPATILGLSQALDYPYLTCIDTTRLEDTGVVIRSGFTPTDLLTVEGRLERWDAEISRLALEHLAVRAGVPAGRLAERMRATVEGLLLRIVTAVAMGLGTPDLLDADPLTARVLASAASGAPDGVVRWGAALDVPVVGIGAPAHAFVPNVAERLHTSALVPTNAEVAGAVGAITGSILETVRVLIRPAEQGFTVHAPDHVQFFTELDPARTYAAERASEAVRMRATAAGGHAVSVQLHVEDRTARISDGGTVHLDTVVIAEATGTPLLA
jgi:N-methylhydantoinase A/oxoprolinase/acetone carboxylase beta subunit